MNISELLFNEMNKCLPFPNGITAVPELIKQTSFFPGGVGYYLEGELRTPNPQIMIMGQDFSTVEQHSKMLKLESRDIDSPTWKHLLSLFNEVGINPSNCFYTNAFIGLRTDGSSIGKFVGFNYPEFLAKNDVFLLYQIELLKPKLIVTLGLNAPTVLSRISSELTCWKNLESFSKLDASDSALIETARFGNHECACCVVVHPSYRLLNVKKRVYKKSTGNEAEVKLLKDALELAGI